MKVERAVLVKGFGGRDGVFVVGFLDNIAQLAASFSKSSGKQI